MANGASRYITVTATTWTNLDHVAGVMSSLVRLTPAGLSTRVTLRGAPADVASAVVRVGASQTARLRYHSSGIVNLASPQLTVASAEVSLSGGSPAVSVGGATPAGSGGG